MTDSTQFHRATQSASTSDPLSAIEEMALPDLRATWASQLSAAPPQLRTRDLMALALAYRLQAKTHGELTGSAKRRMAELARRFTEDRSYTPTPGTALKPGCSLIKEWRGVRHEVRVEEDGFSYQGERFGSLSEVAHHITGTKWNGLVFFGLKGRKR